jgi:MFS family permease
MVRAANFMAMPFLAIYMAKTGHLSPVLIGLAIGVGPLTSTIGGFIGGTLSDMFGRKLMMFIALGLYIFVFAGFAVASHPAAFIVLNSLNGLCRSFFEPPSQALMADLTEKSLRVRVFSYRYTAINIGATVGPLIGSYLGLISANLAFIITAIVYLIYFIFLLMLFKKHPIAPVKREGSEKMTIYAALHILRKDIALRYFIVAGILVNIGYSQVESTLPQYLQMSITDGVILYSVLLSLNAVVVVILQLALTRFMEKISLLKGLIAGASLFSLGYLGFALAHSWWMFIAAMIVVTVGEIFVFPMGGVIIDQLASEHNRGTYFGANSFRSIGFFIGPWFGGMILSHYSGSLLFFIMVLVVASSTIFYRSGYKRIPKKEKNETNQIPSVGAQ